MRQVLKQLARDVKEYVRHLRHKGTLPRDPAHDDIYLVEFPKSGITWLQHIVGNIELRLLGRDESITFYNHHKYLPDVHQLRGSKINRFLDRTFIKSHASFNPYYYFVAYLIRNPFDVMVSYYNFMVDQGYSHSFEFFVKDKNYGINGWKKHINSWLYGRTGAQRIHFIKYEDLVSNTKEEIRNIYENLGVSLPDDILESSILQSGLRFMQESEDHYRTYDLNYTMSFVGKNNKKSESELMTDKIRQYIEDVAREEIKYFYPDFIMVK